MDRHTFTDCDNDSLSAEIQKEYGIVCFALLQEDNVHLDSEELGKLIETLQGFQKELPTPLLECKFGKEYTFKQPSGLSRGCINLHEHCISVFNTQPTKNSVAIPLDTLAELIPILQKHLESRAE